MNWWKGWKGEFEPYHHIACKFMCAVCQVNLAICQSGKRGAVVYP
jgi:hypothetical protein